MADERHVGVPRFRVAPSLVDVLFILIALWQVLTQGRALVSADGDAARHIRVGNEILGGRGFFREDFLSYTMEGQPFVPYEWGAEILQALAYRIGGLPGVVVFNSLLIATSYAVLMFFLRRSGLSPLPAIAVAGVSALLGSSHWLARPHLFTILGSVLLLMLL